MGKTKTQRDIHEKGPYGPTMILCPELSGMIISIGVTSKVKASFN